MSTAETDRPPLPEPGTFGACYDCGRHYGDEYGFPDLVLPNDVWAQISPRGDEGGLLCPSCICRRAHALGMSGVPAMWASGPLKSEPYTPATPAPDREALRADYAIMRIIANAALPGGREPEPEWWSAAKLRGPFTPTGSGSNDGNVRDANGVVVADCGGYEARANVIAELLNRATSTGAA
jgi:hypothetical protein